LLEYSRRVHVAAIDIGTNSIRLLIADEAGREIERPMRITRLGQGVDVTGTLASEAIARTAAVLAEYRSLMARWNVQRVRATATSAARDAQNSQQFFDAAERALGVRPELLSGDEEARLSFRGATHGLASDGAPFLIIDLGGGSTELVLGTDAPEALISLQMGCVRMTERHLKSDPVTTDELAACFADVRQELARAREVVDVRRARTVVGLAGTVTALSAMQLGLTRYDATRTHHSRLTRAQVEALFSRLSIASVAERRGMLAEPARAEVIVGGAAVLLTLMQEFALEELLVSERDILDGLAASLVATSTP
jgi:exopolyphosphatase / guanosine-5'-triphosphate,3'-diphosphate pyrophosphatase